MFLYLLSGSAFATKQWYWDYGGSQITASGNTCDALKEAAGKSSNYTCRTQTPGNTVTDLVGGNGIFLFVHPQYGVESGAPFFKTGPAPDLCEAPRYIGPDTSKPPGQQCERVACVSGDSAGRYEIPTAYVDADGEILQYIQHVADVNWCLDGCYAKARTDDGGANMVCAYNPTSTTGVRIATCTSDFVDSNDKCTVPHDPDAPIVPYDPNTPPPTCGGVGQPACPPAGTCGGPGQPGCPPSTCGGVGQPVCYPGGTCGGAGQPSCSNGDGSGPGGTTGGGTTGGGGPTCGVTGKPACAPGGTCGGTGQPACGTGDGSGIPGGVGECGGVNQPACAVSGDGVPSGAGIGGDLAGLKAKNDAGTAAIDGFSLGGLADWFPQFPTAACTNPTVPLPLGGGTATLKICTYVDLLRIFVSAGICFALMLGSVRAIQGALKA